MARPSRFIPVYYAPDLDPSWDINPGVLNVIQNYVPTKRGTYSNFANGPTQNQSDAGTMAVATYGTPVTGYVFKAVSGAAGAARMFICTIGGKRRIVELTSAAAVTDRSKGATDYSASTTHWTMTNQGNAIIACNLYDAMQVSTSGVFADMGGGAPKAQVCCNNLGFVMVGNYNDGVNAYGDGWWCSALGNYASWTASLATQAANGRLLDTAGPIRAMAALRDSIIAYKDDSIYIGDYIGDTINGIIWGWRLVSDRVGCSSPHGVAVLNGVHYFLHRTGLYAFDGAQVSNIGTGVQRETLRRIGDFGALYNVQAAVDETEGVIYFGFAGTAVLTELFYILMLNVNTGRWGGCMSGSITWQEATSTNGHLYGFMHCTAGDLIQWKADGQWLYTAQGTGPVCIGTNDNGTTARLRIPAYGVAIVGSAGNATMFSGMLTIGPAMAALKRILLRLLYFGTQTATPTANVLHLRQEGAGTAPPSPPQGTAVSPAPTWNASDYGFDCSSPGTSDRVLQYSTTLSGPHEIGGVWVDIQGAGSE